MSVSTLHSSAASSRSGAKRSRDDSDVSERKRAANRANALKSTGPRSAAGKLKASLNALSHGFYSDRFAVDADERVAFDAHRRMTVRALRPRDVMELREAERIAGLQWRIQRVEDAQNELLMGIADDPDFDRPGNKNVDWFRPQMPLDEMSRALDEIHSIGMEEGSENTRSHTQFFPEPVINDETDDSPTHLLIRATRTKDGDTFWRMTQIEQRLDTQLQRAWRQLRLLQDPERLIVDEEDENEDETDQESPTTDDAGPTTEADPQNEATEYVSVEDTSISDAEMTETSEPEESPNPTHDAERPQTIPAEASKPSPEPA